MDGGGPRLGVRIQDRRVLQPVTTNTLAWTRSDMTWRDVNYFMHA